MVGIRISFEGVRWSKYAGDSRAKWTESHRRQFLGLIAGGATGQFIFKRQFEDEGGTFAWAVAVDGERAAHFPGGQRTTVQTETVAVFASREAVRKDAGEIFRGNAHAVVDDFDSNPIRSGSIDAKADDAICRIIRVARIFGVAKQVDEYLDHLVAVDGDFRDLDEFADDFDEVALVGDLVQAQRVLKNLHWIDNLGDARDASVRLLHGDNLFDVLDVFRKSFGLGPDGGAFLFHDREEGFEIRDDLRAVFVLEEFRQVCPIVLQ